jgi:hypothetical protein
VDVFDAAAALARVEERLLVGAFAATYSTRIGLVPVGRPARGGREVVLLLAESVLPAGGAIGVGGGLAACWSASMALSCAPGTGPATAGPALVAMFGGGYRAGVGRVGVGRCTAAVIQC